MVCRIHCKGEMAADAGNTAMKSAEIAAKARRPFRRYVAQSPMILRQEMGHIQTGPELESAGMNERRPSQRPSSPPTMAQPLSRDWGFKTVTIAALGA